MSDLKKIKFCNNKGYKILNYKFKNEKHMALLWERT